MKLPVVVTICFQVRPPAVTETTAPRATGRRGRFVTAPAPKPAPSLTEDERQALYDLYRLHLSAVARLEQLLNLPPSRPNSADRRAQQRRALTAADERVILDLSK